MDTWTCALAAAARLRLTAHSSLVVVPPSHLSLTRSDVDTVLTFTQKAPPLSLLEEQHTMHLAHLSSLQPVLTYPPPSSRRLRAIPCATGRHPTADDEVRPPGLSQF
mmetsp:Transcript_44995/g.117950  ORF Transcript_44995/g.117950 Transcript_44995/m.117950 type:complete len:107 (+) Transcript_44995:142-462(+)